MVAVAETTNLSESAFLEALSSEEKEEFMRDGGFDSVEFLFFAADKPPPCPFSLHQEEGQTDDYDLKRQRNGRRRGRGGVTGGGGAFLYPPQPFTITWLKR